MHGPVTFVYQPYQIPQNFAESGKEGLWKTPDNKYCCTHNTNRGQSVASDIFGQSGFFFHKVEENVIIHSLEQEYYTIIQ